MNLGAVVAAGLESGVGDFEGVDVVPFALAICWAMSAAKSILYDFSSSSHRRM